MLTPLKFVAMEGDRIVDAQIVRKSRDVCGIAVAVASDGSTAEVGWRILEPQDGAIVQVILEGGRDHQIGATGTVEGANRPFYVRVKPEDASGRSDIWSSPTDSWKSRLVVLGMAAFCGALSVHWIVTKGRELRQKSRSKFVFAWVVGTGFGCLALVFMGAVAVEYFRDFRVPAVLLVDEVRTPGPGAATRH